MTLLYDSIVARFDDSIQPTGTIHWSGGFPPVPHVEMKKLSHELHLVIEGPDGSDVTRCVTNAAIMGGLAAVVAAYCTGGAALPAAEAAFTSVLAQCLGDSFNVKFDDHSNWVFWDT